MKRTRYMILILTILIVSGTAIPVQGEINEEKAQAMIIKANIQKVVTDKNFNLGYLSESEHIEIKDIIKTAEGWYNYALTSLNQAQNFLLTDNYEMAKDYAENSKDIFDALNNYCGRTIGFWGYNPGLRNKINVLVIKDKLKIFPGANLPLAEEAKRISNYLTLLGYNQDIISEPDSGGLTLEQIAGYDVVLYITHTSPLDDIETVITLKEYVDSGGNLILTGDDASWVCEIGTGANYYPSNPFWDANPDDIQETWESITHLHYLYNGEYITNTGGYYEVIINEEHPITAGLYGQSFFSYLDIDTTTLLEEGISLATAEPINPYWSITQPSPAIVVWEDYVSLSRVVVINIAFYDHTGQALNGNNIPPNIATILLDNSILWASSVI